jgi:multiple sugar transport system substrate-binding protein
MFDSLSRRDFLKVASATLTSAVLAACQPAAPAAPEVKEAPKEKEKEVKVEVKPEKPAEKVELKFQTHSYQPLVDFTERKIEEYKEVEPNINITFLYTPEDRDKLWTNLAAGTGPDGWNMGDWTYPKMMNNNWLAPIPPESFGLASDQEVIGQFIPASLVALTREGKLYGVPYEWQCATMYYNMNIFKDAGLDPMEPPETWAEWLEVALKTAEWDDQGNLTRAAVNQAYGNICTLIKWRPMYHQLGGRWIAEDGSKMVFTSPETKEAIQFLVDWTVEHRICMDGFEVPGVEGLQASDYMSMWFCGMHSPSSFLKHYPDLEYQVDWNQAPFPHYAGKPRVTGGWRWGLFVNSESKYPVETWAFIKYNVDDWWGVLFDVGYFPSVEGWIDSERGAKALEEMPWIPNLLDELDHAIAQPMTPYWDELVDMWDDGLDRMHGGEPVDEILEEVEGEMNEFLAENPDAIWEAGG